MRKKVRLVLGLMLLTGMLGVVGGCIADNEYDNRRTLNHAARGEGPGSKH